MNRITEWSKKSAPLVLLLSLTMVVGTGCRVRQTEEGDMPDVDVQVEGGKVPEYDVDAADVDVTTQDREITVPEVDVKTQKKTVKVPDVDVKMPPAEDDNDGNRPPQ
jgi:hypothetical protein